MSALVRRPSAIGLDSIRIQRLGSLFGRPHERDAEVSASRRRYRAAIYARPIYDKHGEVVADVEALEARCRGFAAKHALDVVAVFLETTGDPEASRPELRALRAVIWRRDVDVVLAVDPDQLYFDTQRLVRFAREAAILGVAVEFVEAPPDLDLEAETW